MSGYHLSDIPQGQLGELSKITEELYEALDAEAQQCSIMVLVELSDMMGAIEMYLAKHHPSISIDDLRKMSAVTQRAFQSGRRQCKEGFDMDAPPTLPLAESDTQ